MKITFIHQHFRLASEAGGSRPYEFAKRMAADGHDVTMLCGSEDPLDIEVDGFRVKRLAVSYRNEMSVSRRILSFALFMVKSSYIMLRVKPDIIYVSSTPLTVAVPGILGKLFHRVPLVFEVRDLWPSVPIELGFLKNPVAVWVAKNLEKIAYRSADSLIALSPGMKEGILKIQPEKEVTVIPNASDFEIFDKPLEERRSFREEKGWGNDETVIVYAGGFGPTYNLDWVVKLAGNVKDQNIRFILIGEGKETEQLRDLAVRVGLDPDSILVGKKIKQEVAKYVSSADLIISSLREDPCLEVNSLNKVFDGLAAGQPIILNHEGWLKDAIVESNAGWHLDRSIEVASTQLRDIISDSSAIEAAKINSAALGRERFDRNKLYKTLIEVLESTSKASSKH